MLRLQPMILVSEPETHEHTNPDLMRLKPTFSNLLKKGVGAGAPWALCALDAF